MMPTSASASASASTLQERQEQAARTYTQWEYQIVELPTRPYVIQGAPPQAEPRTSTDVLNDWGTCGWQLMGVLAPYTVVLMRPKQESM